MKLIASTKALILATSLICNLCHRGIAQGTFGNLDFESANVPDIPPGQSGGIVFATNGIPGWQAFFGSAQIFSITHNAVSLGAVNISIFGPNYGSAIIEGKYTVNLQAGFNADRNLRDASISQSGLVPVLARSLQLKIGLGAFNYNISLAHQPLQLVVLGTGANYTLYGADISPYAGQVAELQITSLWTAQRPLNPVSLDSILFSPEVIPEPRALILVGFGIWVYVFRTRVVSKL